MESDDREGIIADYLDTLLPEDWDGMDLYQRRSFLGESEFGDAQRKGTVRREKVCVMEICALWKSGVSALARNART